MLSTDYKSGYRDGANDCQKLYEQIIDRLCKALDANGEKEKAKMARKMFAEEKAKIEVEESKERNLKYLKKMEAQKEKSEKFGLFPNQRNLLPLDAEFAKVGEIVFVQSNGVVSDIGIIKCLNPLKVWSRSTMWVGAAENSRWYRTGVVVSSERWRFITEDFASTEDVCKKLNIAYHIE